MDDKKRLETTEFFTNYYSDYVVGTTEIMFTHMQSALKEIHEKHGTMEINDAYRVMSYVMLKVLASSFETKMDGKIGQDLNKLSMELANTIIDTYRDNETGKELAFMAPIVLMDIMAFKDFEYSYGKAKAGETDGNE